MLTTYLFRYTSECTLCSQICKIFFVSGGKGALTPLAKILRTFLQEGVSAPYRETTRIQPRPGPTSGHVFSQIRLCRTDLTVGYEAGTGHILIVLFSPFV